MRSHSPSDNWNFGPPVVERDYAKSAITAWVHNVLRDYDVSEEVFKNDPELGQSIEALLDQMNINE